MGPVNTHSTPVLTSVTRLWVTRCTETTEERDTTNARARHTPQDLRVAHFCVIFLKLWHVFRIMHQHQKKGHFQAILRNSHNFGFVWTDSRKFPPDSFPDVSLSLQVTPNTCARSKFTGFFSDHGCLSFVPQRFQTVDECLTRSACVSSFENHSLAAVVCGYFQSAVRAQKPKYGGHAVELEAVFACLTVERTTRQDVGNSVQRNWEDDVARQTENAGKNNVEGRSFHCTGSRVVSHS